MLLLEWRYGPSTRGAGAAYPALEAARTGNGRLSLSPDAQPRALGGPELSTARGHSSPKPEWLDGHLRLSTRRSFKELAKRPLLGSFNCIGYFRVGSCQTIWKRQRVQCKMWRAIYVNPFPFLWKQGRSTSMDGGCFWAPFCGEYVYTAIKESKEPWGGMIDNEIRTGRSIKFTSKRITLSTRPCFLVLREPTAKTVLQMAR